MFYTQSTSTVISGRSRCKLSAFDWQWTIDRWPLTLYKFTAYLYNRILPVLSFDWQWTIDRWPLTLYKFTAYLYNRILPVLSFDWQWTIDRWPLTLYKFTAYLYNRILPVLSFDWQWTIDRWPLTLYKFTAYLYNRILPVLLSFEHHSWWQHSSLQTDCGCWDHMNTSFTPFLIPGSIFKILRHNAFFISCKNQRTTQLTIHWQE